MKKNIDRIEELISRIFNDNACVFTYDHIAPETFAVDIAGLFNADAERDVLRNVSVGYEEGLVNSTLIIIPETVDSKELFVKLADYVNGIKMEFVLCYCKDKEGVFRSYEIDPSKEYIEGGGKPTIFDENCVEVGEQNILLLLDKLELGVDKGMLPSPVVASINRGDHFIQRFLGPDDEELI